MTADWSRQPGRGRYAQPEFERRFRVRELPAGLDAGRRIEDRYVVGTTLRLRRVSADGLVVHKLTQKVRRGGPGHVALTNLYLTAEEHAATTVLPAHPLVKHRHRWGDRWVVDVFAGPLEGLVLAEIELLAPDEDLPLPGWLGVEVTEDERFSGGALAAAGPADLARLLAAS